MNRIALAFTLFLVASAAGAQQPACARGVIGMFRDIGRATASPNMGERELADTSAHLLTIPSPTEAAALRKAQNAWLNFAAENARFVQMREGTGSSGRLALANNREKITRERTQELSSLAPR